MQALLRFSLIGLETVEQAVAAFKLVETAPVRRWAGSSKQERNKNYTAWAKCRDGLMAELFVRQARVGELAAICSLELHRVAMRRSRTHTQLQSLASSLLKKHRR